MNKSNSVATSTGAAVSGTPHGLNQSKSSLCIAALGLLIAGAVGAASFTPGNVAVVRVGNGAGSLNSAAAPVFIDEYTPAGTLVQSIALPTSGSSAFTLSGLGTTEGALVRSEEGRQLVLAGYNAPSATANVSATSDTAVPRAVGKLGPNGLFAIAAKSSNGFFNNLPIRAAASDGVLNYWAGGAARGTYYFGFSFPAATNQASIVSCRAMGVYGRHLCFSTQSGTRGIYDFDAMPLLPSPVLLTIKTGAGSQPAAFAFDETGTMAYIADEAAGVQKWLATDDTGTNWVLAYTLTTGIGGVRGLAVDISSPTPLLYATTTEATGNHLLLCEDNGPGSPFFHVATAAENTVLRGVALVPLTQEVVIYGQPQSVLADCGGAASFTVRAASAEPVTYQWFDVQAGPIPGATNHTLELTGVTAPGAYYAVISEGGHHFTSATALLTFKPIIPGHDSWGIKFGPTPQTVPLSRFLSNDTHADGTPVTFAGLGPAAYGSVSYDNLSGLITYLCPAVYRNLDSFVYQVVDGCGVTTNVTVTVTLSLIDAPSANVLAGPIITPRNTIYVKFAGVPNKTYRIEKAPQASGPWTFVATVVAARNGLMVIEDPFTPPAPSSIIYRAIR